MDLAVLALDFDGTLAREGQVASDTWAALRQARDAGLVLILVTGRRLETLTPQEAYEELFQAIVAENGAVVRFPGKEGVLFPFGRLPHDLVERLEAHGLPLDRGAAIVGTRVPHDQAVLAVLGEMGYTANIEYNRGAVMVLPPGAAKDSGLRYVLQDLGYSPAQVVACGDGENDAPFLEEAGMGVAVADAVPELLDRADVVLGENDGAGVRMLIADLLAGRIPGSTSSVDAGAMDSKSSMMK